MSKSYNQKSKILYLIKILWEQTDEEHPLNAAELIEKLAEYDISADDLLSGDNRGQKIHAAKEFLQEVLASGSVAQTKVAEEAEVRGIKKKTLWNAKKELEIDSVKIGNQWFWMLPE